MIDRIYNVQLGYMTPIDPNVFVGEEVYLEVGIYNADTSAWETLYPRQRMTSTAFAFRAGDAETLGGKTAEQILGSTEGDGLRVSADTLQAYEKKPFYLR